MPRRKKPDNNAGVVAKVILAYNKMVIDFKRATESCTEHGEILANDLFYESVVDAHDAAVAALNKIAEFDKKRKAKQ